LNSRTPDPATSSSGFDVFDPDFIQCPFGHYQELRESAPATKVTEGKGFWLVTDHELVREVVGDVERFSSESGPLGSTFPSPAAMARMAELTPSEGLAGRVNTLLTLDPPGHTRNRKLISRAFTPASVRRYEEMTRSTCRGLLDGWVDGEEIDFVARFAVPLPVRVIAQALDVPDDRVDDFKRWSDASVASIGADLSDDDWVQNHRDLLELADFLQDQIDRKRAAGPAEDIMSKLVHARLDAAEQEELGGETRLQLSDNEIHSIVRQLLVAGNETTTNLLTQSMVILADHRPWWERMHTEPSMVPDVVEEALRHVTPSAVNQRAARHDMDFHGVQIPAGDVVMVCYLAADHDPAVFPDPEDFDPTRDNLGDHLAFGRGIHFCPGASLARMEAKIAFEELSAAIAGYTIPPVDDLGWNSSFQLRAIRALPFVPTMRA
jgi:cytochrome P450